jgi:DNA-binding NarL/FixJ family response regulator
MKSTEPTTILVVHPQQVVREGLVSMVQNGGHFKVVYAASGLDELAAARARKVQPGIAVVGLGGEGQLTIAYIRQNWPQVPVVAVVTEPNHGVVQRAVSAGARAVLSLDTCSRELDQALQVTARGGLHHNALMAAQLQARTIPAKEQEKCAQVFRELPSRELEVFRWIVHPTTPTYAVIAQKLGIGTRSVHTYRDSVFRKFKVHSRQALLRLAMEQGLLQLPMRR